MGARHDGEERLCRGKHLRRVRGEEMEKVCMVQGVDELDGEHEKILVGYELGRHALSGGYDDGDIRRGCEQDAEGIEEDVVGAIPEAVVAETVKVAAESVPRDGEWSVRVLLNVAEEGDGVSEEGAVDVVAGGEVVEDALHDKAKLG